jgi:DNA-binding NarL/FixJ family response regulator
MIDPHVGTDPPLRILLVQDDLVHADGVAGILATQIELVQVEVVADLTAARLALATGLDLVIADLTLPDADELGVVHALRAASPDNAVIVVTRRDDPALALAAISAGADDVLVRGDHDALMLGAAVQRAVQRRRTQAQLQRRERYAASLLDAAESATCALDAEGRIVSTNASWRSFAAANGGEPAPCGVGASYLDQCDHAVGERCDGATEISDGIRAVLRGDLLRFEHEYSCHAPQRKRWYSAGVAAARRQRRRRQPHRRHRQPARRPGRRAPGAARPGHRAAQRTAAARPPRAGPG